MKSAYAKDLLLFVVSMFLSNLFIYLGHEAHLQSLVSGPESLTEDVRSSLASLKIAGPGSILRGGPSVYLHVERFSF